jgi:protein arginine kinase
MLENELDIVVSSRVRLARNYEDLPFSATQSDAIAQMCVDRVVSALADEGSGSAYALHKMADLLVRDRMSMVESHLISRDLMQNSQTGAVLIRDDQAISLMINEEDHLRLQAIRPGQQLQKAAELAYEVEDALQRHISFAFDGQLGYLTACPTNTGTGMRASLMLHLPLLTTFKQMGNVSTSVAKLGLTIRGIYGEGSEALGNLYQVSNQVTLGRTEGEIIEAVIGVGRQIIDMERNLQKKVSAGDGTVLEDQVYRSLGALLYARRMDLKEFMQHWSNLRLGCALDLLPIPLKTADELLPEAQDAHLMKQASKTLKGKDLDIARSRYIRAKLSQR